VSQTSLAQMHKASCHSAVSVGYKVAGGPSLSLPVWVDFVEKCCRLSLISIYSLALPKLEKVRLALEESGG